MSAVHGGDPLLGNKIAGAVLASLLLVMGLNIGSGIIYTPRKPAVTGYDLPAPEAEAAAGASDQQAQAEPLPILLASADPAKGQGAAKKCLACHSFDKGGPNKIGPNLYGVVGRAKGSHEGFAYSTAMKGKGGEWSYEDINAFITNPKGYVPGTIMAFAGVPSPKERADIEAYLRSLADNPVPFPAAAAATPAAPAAPPGPSQTQQQPSPPMPGQRVEPGPAPAAVQPDAARPGIQPRGQDQRGAVGAPGAQGAAGASAVPPAPAK